MILPFGCYKTPDYYRRRREVSDQVSKELIAEGLVPDAGKWGGGGITA